MSKTLRKQFKDEQGISVMAYRQDYGGQTPYEDGFNDEYVEWLEERLNTLSQPKVIDELVVDVNDYSYKEWRDKYFEAPRIEQDVYFRTKSTSRKISQTQMIRKYQKAYGLI
jgi:hypothetical protein